MCSVRMRPLLRWLFALCPVVLPAVTLTWDTSAVAGYQPGPGAWSGPQAWSLDGVVRQGWLAGADAVFRGSTGGGSDTIALTLPVEVGDLAFGGINGELARGDWSLTGAVLTLTRASRCDVGFGSRVEVSSLLAGSQTWTKGGEGELCLAAESLHRGGLIVEGGGLVFRSTLGAGESTVEMAGGRLSLETAGNIYNPLKLSAARVAIAVDQLDALTTPWVTTWVGQVSGAGALVKTGRGELRLAGANTFAGGVTIEGGMVAVSQSSGLGQGGVRLDGGGLSLISNVMVTNAIEVVAAGSRLSSSLNSQSRPYVAYLTGAVNGVGGVVKVGAGTLWATGSWAHTGGTVVQDGVLMADGRIAGELRVAGGVLGGRGRVGAVVVADGGTLAPGDAYGILTMSSLRLEAGARLLCVLDRTDLGPGGGYAYGMVEGALDLSSLDRTHRARWVLGGKLGNFDLARDQRFVLWRFGELSLAPGLALPDCLELDASAWRAVLGDGFDPARLTLAADSLGRTVYLDYSAALPEPAWYGFTLAGSVGAFALGRRRKRKKDGIDGRVG